MERRVFIAVVLSFLVVATYQTYFAPPTPTKPPTSATSTPAPAAAATSTPAADAPPAADASAASEAGPASVVSDGQEHEITVDTKTVKVVFTNRGARVLHWYLKNYRDTKGDLVDLVPSGLPKDEGTPFTLQLEDAKDSTRLNTALYRVSGDRNGAVDARLSQDPLVFEFQDSAGLSARKEFRFDPERYTMTAGVSVKRGDTTLSPTIVWGPGLGDQGASAGGGSIFTGNAIQPPRAILHHDGKVRRMTADAAAKEPAPTGQFVFVGVDDHYFIAITEGPIQGRAEYRPVTLPGENNTARHLLSYSFKPSPPGQSAKYFVGPKQFDELQAQGPEFVRAIDFGFFAVIVVPLLGALRWIFNFTGNYGWSIILLTIIINLVMFPLRHKSSVAMRKMQVIQPQMKAIQDRYSHLKMTDPGRQRMQEEVSALYKEKGVNPAAGCVPMLLTLPALWAFYSLLSQSIELRGAPFAGWIHDLSAADPYFVLPALMGVTMFWQQRLTPTADPAQQRVMMVMPVMFTAMMAFSASGVVLYWFVSQVWGIGQQYLTNWLVGPMPQMTRQPARK